MLKPSAAAIVELRRIVEAPKPSLVDRILGRGRSTTTGSTVPADRQVLELALAALSRTGDWRALPFLTWLLDAGDSREATFGTIRALMPNDAEALSRLDEGVRETSYTLPAWWPN